MANGLFNLKQVIQAIQQGGWPAQKTPAVEYLVVAGGGGGGSSNGGGGGAGGLLQGIDPVPNGQTLLVTVGGGGLGGSYISAIPGSVGSNSVFGNIAATGGGGGGTESASAPASSGGSGGGANYAVSLGTSAGSGLFGQGNAGGKAVNGAISPYNGGGGGGAGTVGLPPNNPYSGNGGAGIASVISGTVTTYAGGGGAGCYSGSGGVAGVGGVGGGGAGSTGTPTNGTANTGGGGGGSGNGTNSAGTGGSGIVIVSYPDVYAAATATTGSPTVSTSGSGSMAFNGSTQFIQYASNTAFDLGSGNFTIEMWLYKTTTGSQQFLAQVALSPSAINQSIGVGTYNDQVAFDTAVGSTYYSVTTSASLTLNAWNHIACVRNGSTLTVYINGTSAGTGSVTGSLNSISSPMTVGRLGAYNGYYTSGYISNLRLVKGTAVYTSNFTPSTIPLTAISGTSLLLNSVSGAYLKDSSTNSFNPTTDTVAGGWNASSPFTGTGYKNRVYTWTSSGSITF